MSAERRSEERHRTLRADALGRMTGQPDDGSYDAPERRLLRSVVELFDGWMEGRNDIDRVMLAVAEARHRLMGATEPPRGERDPDESFDIEAPSQFGRDAGAPNGRTGQSS